MRYRAHLDYKPSGVQWLGDVPAHWEIRRLKTSAVYWVSNVDKVPSDDELPIRLCNYTDVYYHDHIRPDMGLMETTATAEELRRFGLLVDDILITKDSEEWSDIAVPALVVETAPDLVCGYHLAIIRPDKRKLLGSFLLRAFQSCAINQQFQVAASGVTRYGLPKSAIGEAWVPVPSIEEQRAIADFLDRETTRIDTLVAKKRILIEKLKEKRSTLISCTVTRGLLPEAARAAGLDPHPALKPSGIEWLGNVPAHWEVKPIFRLATTIQTGPFGSQLHESDYVEGGIPLINPAHIVGGRLVPEDHSAVDEKTAARLSRHQLRGGDIIMGRRGEIGRCCVVTSREQGWICGTGSLVIRLKDSDPNYFARLISSTGFSGLLELNAVGTTMLNLSPSIVGRMRVTAPPLQEQRAISDYLDRETKKIDQMIAKVEEAIAKLREYRTTLITAAVTGKIDV